MIYLATNQSKFKVIKKQLGENRFREVIQYDCLNCNRLSEHEFKFDVNLNPILICPYCKQSN